MTHRAPFAQRILSRTQTIGSWLVVGLDPDLGKLPGPFVRSCADSPQATADLIFDFNREVIAGAAACAAAFKPQAAFYEQYGRPGIEALLRTIEHLREREIPILLDGKRNDIGSTAQAYSGWMRTRTSLGHGLSTPNRWQVDAMTINAYLGTDGILPFLKAAEEEGGGLFVLLRTSNPSSAELQRLPVQSEHGPLLWHALAGVLKPHIERTIDASTGLSPIGLVVGATLDPDELAEIRALNPHSLFLMPGIGAQGAGVEGLRPALGRDHPAVLPTASRSILYPEGGRGSWAVDGDRGAWLEEVREHAGRQARETAEEFAMLLGR